MSEAVHTLNFDPILGKFIFIFSILTRTENIQLREHLVNDDLRTHLRRPMAIPIPHVEYTPLLPLPDSLPEDTENCATFHAIFNLKFRPAIGFISPC